MDKSKSMGFEGSSLSFCNKEVKADEGRLQLNGGSELERSSMKLVDGIKLPLAPTLEDFLVEGADEKYLPRPEWCRKPYITDHANSSTKVPLCLNSLRTSVRHQEDLDERITNGNRDDFVSAPENGLLPEQSIWEVSPPPFPSVFSPYKFLDILPLPNEETALAFSRILLFRAEDLINREDCSAQTLCRDFSTEKETMYPTFESFSVDQLDANKKTQNGGGAPLFGKDGNSALHVAIQASDISIHPALTLIGLGAETNFPNRKGITPISVASEKGNLEIVKMLFYRDANPVISSHDGTTPLMQASRNGHVEIVSFLLKHGALPNQTDHRNATALMKASQRGHREVVQILSNSGCELDRVNDDGMSALMLAAEKGHTSVVQVLIQSGAKLDIRTEHNISALMLSCMGGINRVDTVKALLSKGCGIDYKDTQGRTARTIALEKNDNLAEYIDHEVQLCLMKRRAYIERMHVIAMLWSLLHNGRASIPLLYVERKKPYMRTENGNLTSSYHVLNGTHVSQLALVQTMMLPYDLVMSIASFLPLPQLWEKRVEMLSRSYHLCPDGTISCAIDLIDDVLDEIGFAVACDSIRMTAPATFKTWGQWKLFRQEGTFPENAEKTNSSCINSREWLDDGIHRERRALRLRREACFLQILSNRSPLLLTCLSSPPFNMPISILRRLQCISHAASLTKRMGRSSMHFDASVASEIVQLAGELVLWAR